MALGLVVPAAATGQAKQPPPRPQAEAWILVDAADDDVLASRRAGAELAMASTTKLMTAYLTRRELDLDEVVSAAPYEPGPVESLMGLRPGDRVSVEDLLYGLLLASGNDAAVTLAVAAAGSEDAFVAEMNRTAGRLGLDHTSYEDPIGFDGPAQHTSAGDLVKLAIDLRRDRVIREIVDTPGISLDFGGRERRIVNRNNLVRTIPFVDGVKTGYTDDAGYVLVGSGERKGVTLASVVLGAPSESERDAATLELLRYGFSLYSHRTVVERDERLAEVAIQDRDVSVPLAATEDVARTIRRDQDVEVRAMRVPAEIEGPISAGDRLGVAVVTVDGATEGRVPLAALRSAEAASLIERIDAALPGRRAGAWGLLALGALAVLLMVIIPVSLVLRRSKAGA